MQRNILIFIEIGFFARAHRRQESTNLTSIADEENLKASFLSLIRAQVAYYAYSQVNLIQPFIAKL
ncbi:hypothetical protein [Serratia entomophila]|uniref:hypothetical protein n=1 Tax=Serratia entomophila TaxID=42906 RepID=UPI001F3D8679|nr:hypothetical protein [Serratia entomophila]UIW17934.1 hypothetical protein KHA73_21345 [Serratia entomophila]